MSGSVPEGVAVKTVQVTIDEELLALYDAFSETDCSPGDILLRIDTLV